MYKEYSVTDRITLVDLDDVRSVSFSKDDIRDKNIFRVELTLSTNGFVGLAMFKDKDEALNFYKLIKEDLKKNKEKSDVEKRLKAYIENIDTQIAKEVKSYLDKIVKK